MEIRKYFHLLCSYLQTNLIIIIPPPHPHPPKKSSNAFPVPTLQFCAEAVHMAKPKKIDITKYG